MPSYRCVMTIGALASECAPRDVERTARQAVESVTVLEAFRVDVVRGEPCATVRFTGADDAQAREIQARALAAVATVAEVVRAGLAKVVAGRSVPLV